MSQLSSDQPPRLKIGADAQDDEPVTQVEIAPLPSVVTWEGRYVLGPQIGEGGMSVVYEAHDLVLGRKVAVKELRSSALPPEIVLAHEARALAAVDHPNVVRVYAVYAEAKPPFLVMERVRGRSLASLLAEGRLSIARVLPILTQIAAGLDALHRAGIVHGDVKPANVIVDERGQAKLIDVGLTAFLERVRPGEMLGTPSYMAPECARGAHLPPDLAPKSDVYSFGVLCFELIAGRLPFTGSSKDELLRAHTTMRPPMPSYCAGLSTEFDGPLASALSKVVALRPRTCGELVVGLEHASKGSDARGRRLRVLVADDDADQRQLLMSILGAHLPGASITLCGSGRAVLDALAGEPPAVAVLDLAMPDPSGMELVHEVREVSPTTAIVIVTGQGSGTQRAVARELGVRRFLVKPFELDELVLAIARPSTLSPRRATARDPLKAPSARTAGGAPCPCRGGTVRRAALTIDPHFGSSWSSSRGRAMQTRTSRRRPRCARRGRSPPSRPFRCARGPRRLALREHVAPRGRSERQRRDEPSTAPRLARDLSGEWDGGRVAQVVSNLLANALEHGDDSGEVAIVAQGEEHDVELRVHNTGTPIDPGRLPHVFEAMVREPLPDDRNATGLGPMQACAPGVQVPADFDNEAAGAGWKCRGPRRQPPRT